MVMMTLYAFSHFLVFVMQLGKLFRRVVGCPSRFRAWVFFHEPSPLFHLCTVRPNLDGLTSSAEPTLMNFPSLTATASAPGILDCRFCNSGSISAVHQLCKLHLQNWPACFRCMHSRRTPMCFSLRLLNRLSNEWNRVHQARCIVVFSDTDEAVRVPVNRVVCRRDGTPKKELSATTIWADLA